MRSNFIHSKNLKKCIYNVSLSKTAWKNYIYTYIYIYIYILYILYIYIYYIIYIYVYIKSMRIYVHIYVKRNRRASLRLCIWHEEIRSKTSGKIYMKTKYETFLQWNTKFFSSESSVSPTFWILPKLYELCESCRRNSLETL